jgi:ubiquinol-cytochrome c reductase iron-sulfur subunit
MSSSDVNTGRRRFLTGAVAAVGGIGSAFAAVPFIASWTPSDRAKAIGAPVEVDVGKIEPGGAITVKWQGKPVFVVRRTEAALAAMKKLDRAKLRDPASAEEQQPEYATNELRSIKPEFLVLVGLCTHLGCSPKYRPEVAPTEFDPEWKGGFFCPCHGSKFDLAGRVYAGVPAPTNLPVPKHSYLADDRILIGVDPENA